MTLMHKEAFKLCSAGHKFGRDDWVEVDELVAPIVQELNLKGYTTTNCCASHPYPDMHSLVEPDANGKKINIVSKYPRSYFYIALKEKLNPDLASTLPEPFHQVDSHVEGSGVIKINSCDSNDANGRFDAEDDYDYLITLLFILKDLYGWVKDLPEKGK